MKPKEKPCKGTGVAAGYGCGLPQDNRRYGLGFGCKCFQRWLYDTPEGAEVIKKSSLQGKREVKKEQKAKDTETRNSLKTKSDWEAELQKVINSIVRTIDKGCPCISSRRIITGKYDAGHFYSVGSHPALRFNLMNIYAQSVEQNQHKGGNPIGFRDGIRFLYSMEHLEYLDGLRALYPVLKLSIPEIQEAIKKAKSVLSRLKKNEVNRTRWQRLELRASINNEIGIYGEGC